MYWIGIIALYVNNTNSTIKRERIRPAKYFIKLMGGSDLVFER